VTDKTAEKSIMTDRKKKKKKTIKKKIKRRKKNLGREKWMGGRHSVELRGGEVWLGAVVKGLKNEKASGDLKEVLAVGKKQG